MVHLQELITLFSIFIALISLSRCGSFVTVTEDEGVQLVFPYPCDSNTITIQIGNRLPFYNSSRPENLNLPFYQLNKFSVKDKNCSVQVDINPVKRSDEATYICQAYRDGAILSELTRIRLNVNYPPGNLYCTFSINNDAGDDWVPLQCVAPIDSLAGGIYCYQDSKRLPPQSKLVEIGETLTQTIWARKEYPVFCCSVNLYQSTDRCECKDFVLDPTGNISHTNTIKDPCPATTTSLVAILSQYPESEVEENSQLPQLIESLNLTDTNMDKSTVTVNITTMLWVGVPAIGIMVIILMRLYVVEKTNMQLKKCQSANIYQMVENESSCTSSQEKEQFLHVLSSNKLSRTRHKSW